MKPGRKRYAISKGGSYRYALAKLHKTIVDAQIIPELKQTLRSEFSRCGDWLCTKEILKSYGIEIDKALIHFFEHTTVKTKASRR